jgi:hypothetical protein
MDQQRDEAMNVKELCHLIAPHYSLRFRDATVVRDDDGFETLQLFFFAGDDPVGVSVRVSDIILEGEAWLRSHITSMIEDQLVLVPRGRTAPVHPNTGSHGGFGAHDAVILSNFSPPHLEVGGAGGFAGIKTGKAVYGGALPGKLKSSP